MLLTSRILLDTIRTGLTDSRRGEKRLYLGEAN